MFSSNTSQVSGGYEIQRSLRFNSADSAYLNRTPASAGNRQTWTLSVWVKRGGLSAFMPIYSAGPVSPRAWVLFNVSDKLDFRGVDSTNTEVIRLTTTQVFRDPSAWYHIVVAQDTTQATAANRVKIYVNGTQITAFDTATYPSQNISNLAINDALEQNYGRYVNSPSDGYFSGYLTETNFIDGQALTPSSFGAFDAQTGVWGPTRYGGSYGTNGFYLNFSDNSNTTAATLGKDYSPNGNNWTPNNFSVSAGAGNDSLVDVPTNWGTDTGVGGTVRGNYCTMNPLDNSANITLSNGNLNFASSATWNNSRATFGMSSGKWYWETTPTVISDYFLAGIAKSSSPLTGNNLGADANSWVYFQSNGNKINNNTSSAYGASFTVNDVIGVAFDADAGTLTFYKNGISQGVAFSGLSADVYFPAVSLGSSSGFFNFGQRPFAYTAPSGFKALNTQNLPTPTIGAATATQANKYFDILTYTGTAPTPQTVTGLNFQPDFAWVKSRGYNTGHVLSNVLGGPTFTLSTDSTAAEYDGGTANITAFNSNGISVGTADRVNRAVGMVAWNWKANGAGVTNTQGTITSTVSANTTSGFSVVTYTGTGGAATVGHGLGAVPKMVIVKSRSNAINWVVYHESIPSPRSYVLQLNLTDAAVGVADYWGSSGPTSTTFGLNSYGGNNTASATYVAYAFAEVPGYSRFGSYTGNGSNSGPFVFCGFRPAYIMVKAAGAVGAWCIFDAKRNPSNGANLVLQANSSSAEGAFTVAEAPDLLSNGFRLNFSYGDYNASGVQYIFMAFAEAPQKFSLAR